MFGEVLHVTREKSGVFTGRPSFYYALQGQYKTIITIIIKSNICNNDMVIIKSKYANSSATHSKVCTFSTQKEYIILGNSISRQIGTQHN